MSEGKNNRKEIGDSELQEIVRALIRAPIETESQLRAVNNYKPNREELASLCQKALNAVDWRNLSIQELTEGVFCVRRTMALLEEFSQKETLIYPDDPLPDGFCRYLLERYPDCPFSAYKFFVFMGYCHEPMFREFKVRAYQHPEMLSIMKVALNPRDEKGWKVIINIFKPKAVKKLKDKGLPTEYGGVSVDSSLFTNIENLKNQPINLITKGLSDLLIPRITIAITNDILDEIDRGKAKKRKPQDTETEKMTDEEYSRWLWNQKNKVNDIKFIPCPEPLPDRKVEEKESEQKVRSVLHQILPHNQAEVVYLRKIKDWSYEEIASELNIKLDNARKCYSIGKKELKKSRTLEISSLK